MQATKAMPARLVAVVLAGALFVGACASKDDKTTTGDTGQETGSSTPAAPDELAIQAGWVNEVDPAPATGGTLAVTLPAAPFGLDPAIASHGIPTGGAPLTAIYDALIRYDPDTGEYSGQLAEGVTSSADFTTWTLKLRPGVTFTDGTPLDAASVVFSIERMKNARGSVSTYPGYVASFDTPDPLTVVFNLKHPLNNFNALLAGELSYVVSPTAVNADPEGFNTKPVGAGPFTVQSFDPASELVLVKNPGYALGDVALDGIRFTWNAEQQASVDKLLAGESDLIMLTSVDVEMEAIEAGYPAYTSLVAGSGLAVNSSGERTFPGQDPRVRQAMSAAINLETVNERVNADHGVMGPFLYAPGTSLHVDTPFSVYDPAMATSLLEAVKADTGWDGSFQLLTPMPNDLALAYQAQLNAVGFKATIDQVPSFLELASRTNLSSDFDVAIQVFTTFPTNTFQALNRSFNSASASNYSGYANPEMDALLAQLPGADGVDGTKAVLEQMAKFWQANQPFILTGNQPFTSVTGKNVGGLVTTVNGLVLFGKAYLG